MKSVHTFDDDVKKQQLSVHIRKIAQKMGIRADYIHDCADLRIKGHDLIDDYEYVYECKVSYNKLTHTMCYELVGNDLTDLECGGNTSWLPSHPNHTSIINYIRHKRQTNESLPKITEAEPAGHLFSYLININKDHHLYHLDQLRLHIWASLPKYKIIRVPSQRTKTSGHQWYAWCVIVPLAEIEQFQVSA